MTSSVAPATTTIPTSRIWWRGVTAAVIAAVLNAVVARVEVSALALSPDQLSLQLGPVVGFTVVGILAGTGLLVLLRRRGPRGSQIFIVSAVTVGLLSLLLPVAMMINPNAFPGGSFTGGAALIPIHLTAATTAIVALTARSAFRTPAGA